MAVSAFYESIPDTSAGRDIAAINITPLVDVLLVLLIIFMVAAPVVTHRIDLDLPRPTPDATPPPQTIRLGVMLPARSAGTTPCSRSLRWKR